MKKRIISSIPYPPHSVQQSMNHCLDTYLFACEQNTTETYTSPASVFASVKKAIRPGSRFRTWLEEVATQHDHHIRQLPKLLKKPEFWLSPDFPHSNPEPPLSFDTSAPSLATLSLIAYLAGQLDSPAFEALQQIHIFRREFELSDTGDIKKPSHYYCKTPGTIGLSELHVRPAIPLHDSLDASRHITHHLHCDDNSMAYRIAVTALNGHSKMPVGDHFLSEDGSPSLTRLTAAVSDAILRTPEPLRFAVTAPDAKPNNDRQEWVSLLFEKHFWPHTPMPHAEDLSTSLSIPLVRNIVHALHPNTPYTPHCFYGAFGVDRLGETHQLQIHPVGLYHPNLQSNPTNPHDLIDGGAMLMAHDIGFHLPWLSSRTEYATELFLTVIPNVVSEAFLLCSDSLPETHIHLVESLYKNAIDPLYDLDEQLLLKDGPYISSQLNSILRFSLSKIDTDAIDTPPLDLLYAYFLFSTSIAATLSSLSPDHYPKLSPTTHHHIAQAQRHAVHFASDQLLHLNNDFQCTILRFFPDPDGRTQHFISHINQIRKTLLESHDIHAALLALPSSIKAPYQHAIKSTLRQQLTTPPLYTATTQSRRKVAPHSQHSTSLS